MSLAILAQLDLPALANQLCRTARVRWITQEIKNRRSIRTFGRERNLRIAAPDIQTIQILQPIRLIAYRYAAFAANIQRAQLAAFRKINGPKRRIALQS